MSFACVYEIKSVLYSFSAVRCSAFVALYKKIKTNSYLGSHPAPKQQHKKAIVIYPYDSFRDRRRTRSTCSLNCLIRSGFRSGTYATYALLCEHQKQQPYIVSKIVLNIRASFTAPSQRVWILFFRENEF